MPSKTLKEHHYWGWMSHNPKVSPKQRRLAREFLRADKGKKFTKKRK